MLRKNKFTIQPNRITIYPNNVVFKISLFATLFNVILFVIIYNYISTGQFSFLRMVFYCIGLLMLLTPLIGWLSSSTAILFDYDQKAVYRKTRFSEKKVCSFEELHAILPVNTPGGYYYKLTMENNVYGAGIRISPGYGNNEKSALEFEQTVLPAVQKFIFHEDCSIPKNEDRVTVFKYYRRNGSLFEMAPRKYLLPWSAIIFLAVIFFTIYPMPYAPEHSGWKDYLMWITLYLIPIFMAFAATKKIVINPDLKTIKIRYIFNLLHRQFQFSEIVRFQLTRNHYYLIYSGTKVDFVFSSGVISSLRSVYSEKNLQVLMTETEAIFKQQSVLQ